MCLKLQYFAYIRSLDAEWSVGFNKGVVKILYALYILQKFLE